MAKWVLDLAAIKKAGKLLKLQHAPVVNLTTKTDEGFVGYYWPDPLHMIYLNPEQITAEEADLTLWHELCHAMQCEQDFNGDGIQYLIDMWSDAAALAQYEHLRLSANTQEFNEWVRLYYELQPREREAEDVAISYATRFPLTKV